MQRKPLVSIIIVNYNGRDLLDDCLRSLSALTYPKSRTEIILVDNNSQDNSVTAVSKNFPDVDVISLPYNAGFAGGNNVGIKRASGEYVVFLNSDTIVEPEWLTELVRAAEPKNIGLVSSRLLFHLPFVKLRIEPELHTRAEIDDSTDFSPFGPLLEDIHCRTPYLKSLIWYESGFCAPKTGDIHFRRLRDAATVLLPFQSEESESFTLTLHGYRTQKNIDTKIKIYIDDRLQIEDTLKSNSVKNYTLDIKRASVEKNFVWLVQNAGNIVLQDGHSKDRGGILRKFKTDPFPSVSNMFKERWLVSQFYERNSEYFDKPADLLVACGAAALVKKEVLDKLGGFEEKFFMYYEDVDLSLRAWRHGWDIVYQPSAIVYHKHKASSHHQGKLRLESLVARNHLLVSLIYFPVAMFNIGLVIFIIKSLLISIVVTGFKFLNRIEKYKVWNTYNESLRSDLRHIFKNLPYFYSKRRQLNKQQSRSYEDMKPYLY